MKSIALEEAKSYFKNNPKRNKFKKAKRCFKILLEDEHTLNSLIMDYVPENRILSPKIAWGLISKTYTLQEVVLSMLKRNLTFKELAEGTIKGDYKPDWFKRFLPLIESFDYSKVTPLLLTMPNNQEQRHSPTGSFHILDGRHRALSITYLTHTKKIKFQPIEALLLLPSV